MKELVDLAACGTILTSYLGFLPPIAAGFAIIWYLVMLYDRFYRGNK
jgi:hypothetical protein